MIKKLILLDNGKVCSTMFTILVPTIQCNSVSLRKKNYYFSWKQNNLFIFQWRMMMKMTSLMKHWNPFVKSLTHPRFLIRFSSLLQKDHTYIFIDGKHFWQSISYLMMCSGFKSRGRVRVSLTRVRVGFGCQMSGFVWVRVIFVGFSGFSGVEKFLKFWPLLLFLMHFYAWIFFKLQKIYNFEKNNVKKKFHLMKNLVLFGKNF